MALIGVLFNRLPLPKANKLDELMIQNFGFQSFTPGFDCRWFPPGDRLIPGMPTRTVMGFFNGHKQGIVVEPIRLGLAKVVKLLLQIRCGATGEAGKGLFE